MFTDAQILNALQEAARLQGEPLSHTRYDQVSHQVEGPSSARIIQRFGTWRHACDAAGVQPGAVSRSDYRRKWTDEEALEWVAEYLRSTGARGTYADYAQWARQIPAAPSSGTLRNMLGPWNEVKRSALLLVEAAERGDPRRSS